MVDVGAKPVTARSATARALVRLPAVCARALQAARSPKGDVLGTARLAGIQAAKRTAGLIPLCHVLPLDAVELAFASRARGRVLAIQCTVRCRGATGVEMEALTGATIAALTVYDMLKALSHDIRIDGVELLAKSGGRSGDIRRRAAAGGRRR